MQKDSNLTHQQSFGLIEQMIAAAKNEHREKGDGWLLWGWLLFIASFSSVILIATGNGDFVEWIWLGMIVIGTIVAVFLYAIKKKNNEVTTYAHDLLNKLLSGFFISLVVMIAASYITRSYNAFGYYYILYAFWMFIHGSAIRFRPLIAGAIINWIAAIAMFFASGNFLYMMTISSIAILAGYLVPGYMLRNQFNKKNIQKRESK